MAQREDLWRKGGRDIELVLPLQRKNRLLIEVLRR
jgi:hypothetical protein